MRGTWVEQVVDLLDREFPDAPVHTLVDGQRAVSAPGFHLVTVLTSEDFVAAPDLLYVREPEWAAHLAAGVSDFVERFGRPVAGGVLGADGAVGLAVGGGSGGGFESASGEVAGSAAGAGALAAAVRDCFGACDYQCWIVNRIVFLGVGQRDRSQPLELFVGVGLR